MDIYRHALRRCYECAETERQEGEEQMKQLIILTTLALLLCALPGMAQDDHEVWYRFRPDTISSIISTRVRRISLEEGSAPLRWDLLLPPMQMSVVDSTIIKLEARTDSLEDQMARLLTLLPEARYNDPQFAVFQRWMIGVSSRLAAADETMNRVDSLEAVLKRAHVVAIPDSGMAIITRRAYMQQGRESIPIEGTEYTTREMHYFTRYEISFEPEVR